MLQKNLNKMNKITCKEIHQLEITNHTDDYAFDITFNGIKMMLTIEQISNFMIK